MSAIHRQSVRLSLKTLLVLTLLILFFNCSSENNQSYLSINPSFPDSFTVLWNETTIEVKDSSSSYVIDNAASGNLQIYYKDEPVFYDSLISISPGDTLYIQLSDNIFEAYCFRELERMVSLLPEGIDFAYYIDAKSIRRSNFFKDKIQFELDSFMDQNGDGIISEFLLDLDFNPIYDINKLLVVFSNLNWTNTRKLYSNMQLDAITNCNFDPDRIKKAFKANSKKRFRNINSYKEETIYNPDYGTLALVYRNDEIALSSKVESIKQVIDKIQLIESSLTVHSDYKYLRYRNPRSQAWFYIPNTAGPKGDLYKKLAQIDQSNKMHYDIANRFKRIIKEMDSLILQAWTDDKLNVQITFIFSNRDVPQLNAAKLKLMQWDKYSVNDKLLGIIEEIEIHCDDNTLNLTFEFPDSLALELQNLILNSLK